MTVVRKPQDLFVDDKGHLYSESGDITIIKVPSPNYTKNVKMVPDSILVHWTGGTAYGPAVNWFKSKKSKVSAHIIIDRDGRIIQMVSFDRRAWHAGRSSWRGRKSCNGFSVGIELVNPGPVEKIDENTVKLRRGKIHKREKSMDALEDFLHKGSNGKMYLRYTNAQMSSLRHVMIALHRRYKIEHVMGHQDVAPGRKIDPGPELSYERLQMVKRHMWKEFKTRDEALSHIQAARKPKPAHKSGLAWMLRRLADMIEAGSGVNRKDRPENESQ